MKNTLTTTNKNSTCITRSTTDKVVILLRYFATLPDWEVSITYSSNGLLKIYYDSLFLFFFAGDGFTGNVSESYKEKNFFFNSIFEEDLLQTNSCQRQQKRVYLHQGDPFLMWSRIRYPWTSKRHWHWLIVQSQTFQNIPSPHMSY